MAAGDECKALGELADRLCAEFGYPVDTNHSEEPPAGNANESLFGTLSPEDERLIAAARASLSRIAAALRAKLPADVPKMTVGALLDGAELIMRDELAQGKRPSAVLPSVVFLIAVPALDQDGALELSQRAESMLEEALG